MNADKPNKIHKRALWMSLPMIGLLYSWLQERGIIFAGCAIVTPAIPFKFFGHFINAALSKRTTPKQTADRQISTFDCSIFFQSCQWVLRTGRQKLTVMPNPGWEKEPVGLHCGNKDGLKHYDPPLQHWVTLSYRFFIKRSASARISCLADF